MLEDIRLRPLHIFLALHHAREQKRMVFVKHFERIIGVLADPMRVVHILSPSCQHTLRLPQWNNLTSSHRYSTLGFQFRRFRRLA